MHIHARLLLAALTAALALSLAATTASALISLTVEGGITISANGIITFEKAGTSIECPTTIVKTISSAIPEETRRPTRQHQNNHNRKTQRHKLQIVARTDGPLQNIIILEITNTAKYRLFFQGIQGTLPIITGIHKTVEGLRIGFELRSPVGNIICLYEERVRAEGRPLEAVEELNEREQLIRISLGRNLLIRTREKQRPLPIRRRTQSRVGRARHPAHHTATSSHNPNQQHP